MVHWIIAQDGESELRELYERHYSSRTYRDGRKPKKFIGPGEYICLTLPDRTALFVWRKFRDESGQTGVNNSIFRCEKKGEATNILASDLIREADAIADFCWPGERHYTYVRAKAIKSRNPGWCFICAGWRRCGYTKAGLHIFERLFPRQETLI